ncbi:MAG: hypothetical protein HY901_38675 [Deltaproteobacteria bacterium]|nr:hypothetical protein [Deltaproteobacteria bacterium]
MHTDRSVARGTLVVAFTLAACAGYVNGGDDDVAEDGGIREIGVDQGAATGDTGASAGADGGEFVPLDAGDQPGLDAATATFDDAAITVVGADAGSAGPDAGGGPGLDAGGTPPVNCQLISAANPAWEVCLTGAQFCAGVFTDGAGCAAFCAPVGLACTARFGGSPGCQKEPQNVRSCGETTWESDWCECGVAGPGDQPDAGGLVSSDAGTGQVASCQAHSGSLSQNQTYTLRVDAHSGDEDTTQPKIDANNGSNGDNPRFRRNNVARAHNDYWYTSIYQSTDEPDPRSAQWVDYVPDFAALGVGCYKIVATYRATSNRAPYPIPHRVEDTGFGDFVVEVIQHEGDGEYVDVELGDYFMCTGSKVQIQDPGASTVHFGEMRFTYRGSSCP